MACSGERRCDDCGQLLALPFAEDERRCSDCAAIAAEQWVRSSRWQPPPWCKLPVPPFRPVLEVYEDGQLKSSRPLDRVVRRPRPDTPFSDCTPALTRQSVNALPPS